MGVAAAPQVRVDLLVAIRFLYAHLTASLCESAWVRKRVRERVREWSLEALVRFWMAVILRAPPSLTHALQAIGEGKDEIWPVVSASPEAFFQKCRDLHWRFFSEVFAAFVRRVVPEVEPLYAAELTAIREEFGEVWVVDGSRLDKIKHRLKKLWNERAVILPGCLLVAYDLFRGIPRVVRFDPDAARAEIERAVDVLAEVPHGALLLADRLYAVPAFFAELKNHGLFGLVRPRRRVKTRKLECLSRGIGPGFLLEEWLVEMGGGTTAPKCRMRLIRIRGGRKVFELLTNVLDPKRLSAAHAFALYRERWTIERLFFDLKEVLNLHCFYAANPNAVAMQVYAAAIVYVAVRVAQGRIAHQAGIQPEAISPAKFYPLLASAAAFAALADVLLARVVRMNPGRNLRLPRLAGTKQTTALLQSILVEKRSDDRRERRFCKSRGRWKSLKRVPRALELS